MRALRPIRFVVYGLRNQTNARGPRSCTALVAVLLAGCASAPAGEAGETVVLVVRHAERASDAANSDLSAPGLERARTLSRIARERGVGAVYTTDLCRTAQTGLFAAREARVAIGVLATGSSAAGLDACTPAIDVPTSPAGDMDSDALALRIRGRHAGATVLVVGHSNTVPALVGALAGRSACPQWVEGEEGRCILPESAYGDLFVVHLPSEGPARVERLRFDAGS